MRALAHPTLRRLALRLRHFVPSRDGVAAVEFAMVLPVMVLMYLGMTELTFAVNTDRKITLLSRTLADLTGRATSVNTTDMDTIFNAASSVMAPYSSDQAKLTVSSIVVKDTGTKDQNGLLEHGARPGQSGWACEGLDGDRSGRLPDRRQQLHPGQCGDALQPGLRRLDPADDHRAEHEDALRGDPLAGPQRQGSGLPCLT